MTHLFISYSKKETRLLAIALEEGLNALDGVTAWVDRSLRAGKDWEIEIQKEILKCDYFVVLYSPDINRHLKGEDPSYVLTEISYAKHQLKKPIIPVMAQKTDPPMALTTAHYIDYVGFGLTADDLIGAICAECGIRRTAKPQPPAQQQTPPPVVKPVTPPPVTLESLLPAPFAMVPISAGKVTIKGKVFDLPAFQMARYPVTNAQYKLFVDANGYSAEQWWTADGWAARQEKGWAKPRYWGDAQYEVLNRPDRPVVGVSWYEAAAFCRWLSAAVARKIALPTEQMWQRAAQGDQSFIYPWGNEWDGARCQNSVGRLIPRRATAPVTQYAGKGDSPFGVSDMAGNVWEWCLTDYETGGQDENASAINRVLRGGSWYYNYTDVFRADYRFRNSPDNWSSYGGFRFSLL